MTVLDVDDQRIRGSRVVMEPAIKAKMEDEQFDPAVHLCYEAPGMRHSLSELGLSATESNQNMNNSKPLTDLAYTEPFPLISPAGVTALRACVESEKQKCAFKMERISGGEPYNKWELRGLARHAPFLKALWSSEEMNAAVSDALGFPVVPTMEYELGHTNYSMPPEDVPENAVDGWHYDSNCPFVVIVMLSETDGVLGGETAMMRADGSQVKVKYPSPGWAVAMQGMQVHHAGVKVISGGSERLTMVTSYQAQDWSLPNWNDGIIDGVRPVSDLTQLYGGWSASRLTVLAKRAAALAARVEEDREEGRFDFEGVKAALAGMEGFIRATSQQMPYYT